MGGIVLREHQTDLVNRLLDRWAYNPHLNLLAVLATSGGKTAIVCHLVGENKGVSLVLAHRDILISQLSLTLCKFGIVHNLIASAKVKREITKLQCKAYNTPFLSQDSMVHLAGVDTLSRRLTRLKSFLNTVDFWALDEAHHCVAGENPNMWGRVIRAIPNARGLGVTATPIRSDKKGLGSHASGVFDDMLIGVSMSNLIQKGYLSSFKVYAPKMALEEKALKVSSSTGEFTKSATALAVDKYTITGDILSHYKRLACGKRAITFVPDSYTGEEIKNEFNSNGFPTEFLTAKTPTNTRYEVLDKLKRGVIKNVVNINLFGEGFDAPAVEVVIMARITNSIGLFRQQFGRALRYAPGKDYAIIIDHVNNTRRHGFPTRDMDWSLDGAKGSKNDHSANPQGIITCLKCLNLYPKSTPACPMCGAKREITRNLDIEYVDADLWELTDDCFVDLSSRIDDAVMPPGDFLRKKFQVAKPLEPKHFRIMSNQRVKATSQEKLRNAISFWATHKEKQLDLSNSDIREAFLCEFNIGVAEAQTLGPDRAESLRLRISESLLDLIPNMVVVQ